MLISLYMKFRYDHRMHDTKFDKIYFSLKSRVIKSPTHFYKFTTKEKHSYDFTQKY